jgi:D-proline reductase (dithiol) PrdB
MTTAGLHRYGDRPFTLRSDDYRIISNSTPASELVMSHVSTNFDRTGFQQDFNVVLPVDRIRELAGQGVIGSVADNHYSFMGATRPEQMGQAVRTLTGLLKEDRVDGVLLIPV